MPPTAIVMSCTVTVSIRSSTIEGVTHRIRLLRDRRHETCAGREVAGVEEGLDAPVERPPALDALGRGELAFGDLLHT